MSKIKFLSFLFKKEKENENMKYQVITKDNTGKYIIEFINGGKKDLPEGDHVVSAKIAEAVFPTVNFFNNNMKYLDFAAIIKEYGYNNISNKIDIVMDIAYECFMNNEYAARLFNMIYTTFLNDDIARKKSIKYVNDIKEFIDDVQFYITLKSTKALEIVTKMNNNVRMYKYYGTISIKKEDI